MLISDEYLAGQREMHARGNYGVSGHKWAALVDHFAVMCEAGTVLDYGCGAGTLKRALGAPDYEVIEYDPAIPDKETKPEHADFVVCGDVLEHIEPDCLFAVLDDIRRIARRAVFLVVATRPAVKTLPDGRNAHLIVEPAHWWLPKITDRWRLIQFTDRGGEFHCFAVVP